MKSIEEIIKNYSEYETYLDDRFGSRFCDFLTEEQGKDIGFTVKEECVWKKPKKWTKQNVIRQLKRDIEFGIEKAEGQRGISSSLMFDVCKSWLKVLEDKEMLEKFENYYDYGLNGFYPARDKYC